MMKTTSHGEENQIVVDSASYVKHLYQPGLVVQLRNLILIRDEYLFSGDVPGTLLCIGLAPY